MEYITIEESPNCKLLNEIFNDVFTVIKDDEFDSISVLNGYNNATFVNIKFNISILRYFPRIKSPARFFSTELINDYTISVTVQPKQSIEYINLDIKIENPSSFINPLDNQV